MAPPQVESVYLTLAMDQQWFALFEGSGL